MGLFGFGKKKKETQGCGCGCGSTDETKGTDCGCQTTSDSDCGCGGDCGCDDKSESSIKILGAGCQKCNQLEDAVKDALVNMGMDTTIDHVTDFAQIAAYGVMTTPALVVDGKVLSYGKVLKASEAEELIKKARS